ncbi:MAG TPA: hypothetical protein VEG40_10155 [Gaiellaceae bacterium]|nr:hypothetical protein [Gaiellaceae bacterium]
MTELLHEIRQASDLQAVVDLLHEEIDSDRPAAFGADDRASLERVAELLAAQCAQ